MRFEGVLTLDDAKRGARVATTEKMYATAQFEAVRALHVFRQVYLKPISDGIKDLTTREHLLRELHHRLTALVGSARRLNARSHFQSISAAARSVFEVGLDLAICAKDQTDQSADRVEAFNQVEKFKTAQVIARFYKGKPAPKDFGIADMVAFA